MRDARFALLLAALVAAAGLIPQEAGAVPVFSRKYGVNCTMCHSSYPRLNDFGARFRANGYRMPGLTSAEKTVLESPAPIALRTSGGYNVSQLPHTDVNMALELNGLDVLSAGLLGQKIGYFLVFTPGIPASKGVAAQDASLEMASVVFSGMAKDRFTVRAGRFEPAYVAFSAKRSLSIAPYEVYDQTFVRPPLHTGSGEVIFPETAYGPAFTDTRTGIEARYGGHGAVRAYAGLLAGAETNLPKDLPEDAYVRLEGVLGQGEGQTAGQRVGLVGYLGRARPYRPAYYTYDSTHYYSYYGFTVGDPASFARMGVDASLNSGALNLGLQYLWARDDKSLWDWSENVNWSGGFAEMTYHTPVGLTGFTRVDLLNRPSFLHSDLWRFTAGGRYYFVENLAAHLEYSHRADMDGAGLLEDFVTARLDMAF